MAVIPTKYRVTRIDNIDRIRKAYIMLDDTPIAELYHEFSSISGEFDWVFKPLWDNWEKLEKRGLMPFLPGIDESLHKGEYIRRYNPVFVTQRTIPEGRSDLYPLLKRIGLVENDLFEVMCRTHAPCGNNDLYVSRTPDKVIDVNAMYNIDDIPDFDTTKYGWL